MNQRIDAQREILQSSWIPENIKTLLSQYSVAVHTLDTPLDEEKLVDEISLSNLNIVQIAYAHEVPPYFTRENQYSSPPPSLGSKGEVHADPSVPGLYGFILHPNAVHSLVLFIRGMVIDLSEPYRPRIDAGGKYIRGVFDQYRRLTAHILKKGGNIPALRIVGALPGNALRLFERGKLNEYEAEVAMLRANNRNSARFVVQAVRESLATYGYYENQLILLGSAGLLGSEVSQSFPQARKIDVANRKDFPHEGDYLILDMTGGGSLHSYESYMRNGIIWLNEAFPPPLGLDLGPNVNMKILHIQGVAGEVVPPFPYGYGNVPPCCMATDEQEETSVKILEIQ